jgi:NADH:ubiquinone oxidoreductase subunit 3 (subunit A)
VSGFPYGSVQQFTFIAVVAVAVLIAIFFLSVNEQQPPWEGCRAASKTEYESRQTGFSAANQFWRVCKNWPLVAALLLVLSPIVRRSTMREWLIADVSLWDVHIQTWMLVVLAFFLFGFGYVWRQQR